MISIHAPLARCDGTHPPLSCTDADFNPRTSCEVRRHRQNRSGSTDNFNPRTSCEVRLQEQVHRMRLANFNPRTSCEVRQRKGQRSIQRHYFNPRTSCEVRRSTVHYGHAASAFQSTHLLRGATIWISSTSLLSVFQSTHLLRGATARYLCRIFTSFAHTFSRTSFFRLASDYVSLLSTLFACASHTYFIFSLKHQSSFCLIACFCANMPRFLLVMISEIIHAQTILLRINKCRQFMLKATILRCI